MAPIYPKKEHAGIACIVTIGVIGALGVTFSLSGVWVVWVEREKFVMSLEIGWLMFAGD